MLITYLVTVYNKQKYIANVIDSLKSIKGNFRKEFVIIDDGSTDQSLEIIKGSISPLTRATVIHQKNHGPALSINRGLKLASGDFVHFIDGDDVIAPDGTELLLNACSSFRSEVAYGLRGKFDHQLKTTSLSKRETGEVLIIDIPVKAILEGRITGVRTIGSSGSLVSRHLLEKISGADPEVFVQDLSISLKCAKFSKFAFVQKTVSFSPLVYNEGNLSYNKAFEGYNTLKAILGFIEVNEDIASGLKPELYRALWSTLWKVDKFNIGNLPRYLLAKYVRRNISYEDLILLYKEYTNKLL